MDRTEVTQQQKTNYGSQKNGRRFIAIEFLADRTNGRAYATVLRLSTSVVCRL